MSVRGAGHPWDPRQQRPELWRLYNTRLGKDQTARFFPLSNWTETDIWAYTLLHKIELAPLYFAAPRPVVQRAGSFIVVDETRRTSSSERQGRISDGEDGGSLGQKKREGYF